MENFELSEFALTSFSRSLYSYFNYLASVTAGGPRSPPGHM